MRIWIICHIKIIPDLTVVEPSLERVVANGYPIAAIVLCVFRLLIFTSVLSWWIIWLSSCIALYWENLLNKEPRRWKLWNLVLGIETHENGYPAWGIGVTKQKIEVTSSPYHAKFWAIFWRKLILYIRTVWERIEIVLKCFYGSTLWPCVGTSRAAIAWVRELICEKANTSGSGPHVIVNR